MSAINRARVGLALVVAGMVVGLVGLVAMFIFVADNWAFGFYACALICVSCAWVIGRGYRMTDAYLSELLDAVPEPSRVPGYLPTVSELRAVSRQKDRQDGGGQDGGEDQAGDGRSRVRGGLDEPALHR